MGCGRRAFVVTRNGRNAAAGIFHENRARYPKRFGVVWQQAPESEGRSGNERRVGREAVVGGRCREQVTRLQLCLSFTVGLRDWLD